MQRLDGDDAGIDVVTGAVGLSLATARMTSGRIGLWEVLWYGNR
jgi:hypothetical protein